MTHFFRKTKKFFAKTIYVTTIASTLLWTLGSAAIPVYASTTISAASIPSGVQTVQPGQQFAVLGLNITQSAAETLGPVSFNINAGGQASSRLRLSDLAALSTNGTSGIALYKDNKGAGTTGAFDPANDTVVTLAVPPTANANSIATKLTPTQTVHGNDPLITVNPGDLFVASGGGGAPTWNIITTGNSGANGLTSGAIQYLSDLNINSNGAYSTSAYNSSSYQFSKFTPAATGSFTINGTSNTTTFSSNGSAPAAGDVIFVGNVGSPTANWAMVTGAWDATHTPNSGGANLSTGTYQISKVATQAGTFTVPKLGAVTATGAYTAPAIGDLVFACSGSGSPLSNCQWGTVTNNTMQAGVFAINGLVLAAAVLGSQTYQISKLNAYSPTSVSTADTATALTTGDVAFYLTPIDDAAHANINNQNYWRDNYNWNMVTTGAASITNTALRINGISTAPLFTDPQTLAVTLTPAAGQTVPANDTGVNAGSDYFIVLTTSAGAVQGHQFTASISNFLQHPAMASPGSQLGIVLLNDNPALATDNVTTPTITIGQGQGAVQNFSAGANTTVFDTTGGHLRLKQGSGFKAAAGVQFGSNENGKTLTSIAISFATANGTSPTWTASSATSSELADLATADGGVTLWKDLGTPGFQGSGTDQEVTLSASPTYGASGNTLTLTPATPPTIASNDVYFVVLKSKSSGVTNNNAFTMSIAANGIATSGTSPTLGNAFQSPPVIMDTVAPTITSVTGFPGSSTLTVHFSEPVQKINAGGNVTFTSVSDPLVFTDGDGTAQTITAIAHTAGQNFATLTMSGNLDAGDFSGTPSTIASAVSKIEDGAGNLLGTSAVTLSSPLTITTATVPATSAGSVFGASSPLVTFAAAGGTAPYTFTPNNATGTVDSDTLTALGLSLASNGKLTTPTAIANVTGSRTVTVKVTDSTGGTPLTATQTFTINVCAASGCAGIANLTPAGGAQGATNLSVTITGVGTAFTSSSTVSFLLPPGVGGTNGVTTGTVTANSGTSITVPVTIASGASVGNRDVVVTTGSQVVALPSGFSVGQAIAAGLNLAFPQSSATGVPIPPSFNFNPSTNATITNYRISVSTVQDFSSVVWDYAFPKPADAQNSNGSECNASTCNVNFGDGKFLPLTPPTQLQPNTSYFWRVQTYTGTLASATFSNALNAVETTPVSSFTTVSSVTDIQPPQIQHTPVAQAAASTALKIFARVGDDKATDTSTPPLTEQLTYCAGSGCSPSTNVSGVSVGSGYYSFTIPSGTIGTAGTIVRYFISASDGTNTGYVVENAGGSAPVIRNAASPYQLTSGSATAATITGSVHDSSDACPVGIQGATVFADGTGFSTTTAADCTYTLSGLAVGTPYSLVAVKSGYADRRSDGVPSGSSTIAFQLPQGAVGGFGGDLSKPHVRFNAPMNGMSGMPGADSNFKIIVGFDKLMSQTSITTSGNMKVNDVNTQTGVLTDITTSKGSWTYYPTFTMPDGHSESNVAVWSFLPTGCSGAPCTFGDNKTIAVDVTPNVTDTSGNAITGNQSDGNYVFSFTTSSTASFSGFNSTTNTFSGGGTFGSGQFVPPHVVGTTPPPGSQSVPRNAKLLINFSDPMADDGGGYTLLSNVKLFESSCASASSSNDVSSTALNAITLSSDKLSAQIALKSSYNTGLFKSSSSYCLQLLGGVKAASGMTLFPPNQVTSAAFFDEFKTSSTSDSSAPTVTGSFPDTGSTNVSPSIGAINVSFSSDIDPTTVTTSTFKVAIGSTAISGTVEYHATERAAYFLPQSALSPNTTYTVTIVSGSSGVKGLNGIALASDAVRSFTTGAADTTQPKVQYINADDYSIAITFSKSMNAAKATDTRNFPTSILKSGNFALKYGANGFNPGSAGTSITLPATSSFTYDAVHNTLTIQGYHDSSITSATLLANQDLYVAVTGVVDIAGNTINTTGGVNTAQAPILNSATTKGALGPAAVSGDVFSQGGQFVPQNFSTSTFGFAPPVDAHPFNTLPGQTTTYHIGVPVSKQIPDGGAIVLTFPTGFDVSGAKQDVNSPNRFDFNGPGAGTPTFKCASAGAPAGASCAGTANSDDTGVSQGGLAGDGVVVDAVARTVTIYISGGTRSVSGDTHDFLGLDITGIKNSTTPKDSSTSGYTIDVKTKNGTSILESLTSQPFFIQSAGSSTLSGTITATGNDQTGTMNVYLMSPQTGPLQATSADFASGTTAAFSFANIPNGQYQLFTDQSITLGSKTFVGQLSPVPVTVNGNTVYNFSVAQATGGTSVTVTVNGPAGTALSVFANSGQNFRVSSITLNGGGTGSATLNLPNGTWNLGVGPQMPQGITAGPPPAPTTYIMPKPKTVIIANPACTIDGTATCTPTITLTSATKTIKGLVQDGSGKVMANVNVQAFSPTSQIGTFANTDSSGAFTLNVGPGTYNVGAGVPGMGSSSNAVVTVTSDATTYLLINGSTTAITPAVAATTFIIKIAKPDFSISGKVTDGTNAVQGANVYAYRTDAPGNANANTDQSGNYTLYVSSGTWHVGTVLPQYGQLTEQTVIVTTSNATSINFTPTSTGTFYNVSGTVTSGGAPVQGAFVRIHGNSTFNQTASASDGTYTFKVPVGNGYLVDATIPGSNGSLPINLPPLTSFNVTNADVSGENFTVATSRTVTVTFSATVSQAFVELRSTTGFIARTQALSATTATLSVPDGSYLVRVDLPGTAIVSTNIADTSTPSNYASATGTLTVAGGNEALTVTLPTLRTISITVNDDSSTPAAVSGAFVDMFNPTTGIHAGNATASDGTLTLNIADGTYFINAMKSGYFRVPTSLIVNGSTAAQVLTLPKSTVTISGQVLVGGVGVAKAFVHADKDGGGFSGTQADANGNYTLSVNSGTWKVSAIADGYAETALSPKVDTSSGSASGKNITLSTTVATNTPVSQAITPASGGSVQDSTTGISLNVPANALGTSTSAGNIQVKKTNNVTSTNTARPFAGIEITATDSSGNAIKSLTSPVTVSASYTKTELSAINDSNGSPITTKAQVDKIQLAFWDETSQTWTTLNTTVTYLDSSGNAVTSPSNDLSNVASVQLSALTSHFSLYAPIVATDPSAPSTPTGLAAGSATTNTLTLTWTTVAGATSYDIYRSATSGGTFSRLGSEPTLPSGATTTYTDSGLTASTTYYYEITALNSSGESVASSAVAGTTSATSGGSGGGGGGGGGTVYVAPSMSATPSTTTQSSAQTPSPATGSENVKTVGNGKFEIVTPGSMGETNKATPATRATPAQPGVKPAIPATPAQPSAKSLVTVKALPTLSKEAAKVVTSVLKQSAIIILPQSNGAAYYLDPKTQEKASLGRPAEAFQVMRSFGLGITNADLDRIPAAPVNITITISDADMVHMATVSEQPKTDLSFACKFAGRILLQVQSHGEAWYVNPSDCKRYFLGKPSDAFALMRKLALGVSNTDAALIPEKKIMKSEVKTGAAPSAPAASTVPAVKKKITAAPKKNEPLAFPASQLTSFAQPLYLGSKGDQVKTLQALLKHEGQYAGAITGILDAATQAALKQFQIDNNIAKQSTPGFGNVGPATRKILNGLIVEAQSMEKAQPATSISSQKSESSMTPASPTPVKQMAPVKTPAPTQKTSAVPAKNTEASLDAETFMMQSYPANPSAFEQLLFTNAESLAKQDKVLVSSTSKEMHDRVVLFIADGTAHTAQTTQNDRTQALRSFMKSAGWLPETSGEWASVIQSLIK